MPYDVEVGVTKDFPLGRWVRQQRKALRAGELEDRRKVLLDAPEAGMVWEPGEEAWEAKLAALRSFRRVMGHLVPRQDAVRGEAEAMVPVGQHMANLRRKGGPGKDPKRAAERAAQLAAIDPDGNCPWPMNWQRHYRVLADLVDADGHLPKIQPKVLFEGDDIGTWRWRQQEPGAWAQLLPEQRERLATLGVRGATLPVTAAPAEFRPALAAALKGPKKAGSKAEAAFQRGVAALSAVGGAPGAAVRPARRCRGDRGRRRGGAGAGEAGGVASNTKSRRDKLSADELSALAALGVALAGPAPAAQAVPAQPAAVQPAPSKRLPRRDHHDECDRELYEGGGCTCDLIEQHGPRSERDNY